MKISKSEGKALGIHESIPSVTSSVRMEGQQNHHFPTGFPSGADPDSQINTLPIFPNSAPIQNLFNAPVILCQPPASLPTCLCRDPTGCESQGVEGSNYKWILDSGWKSLTTTAPAFLRETRRSQILISQSCPDSVILHQSLPSVCSDFSSTKQSLAVLIYLQKCEDAEWIN